jgi:hypothetical protein
MIAPIDVELSEEEIAQATGIGVRRHRNSAGYQMKHGVSPEVALNIDITGSLGELAFCKAVGFVWPATVDHFKLADVSHNIQVRTAVCKARKPPDGFGTLIVRADDDDRDNFVLVVGNPPHYRVMGWIPGGFAKQDRWIKAHADRPDAWFVPSSGLFTDLSEVSPK